MGGWGVLSVAVWLHNPRMNLIRPRATLNTLITFENNPPRGPTVATQLAYHATSYILRERIFRLIPMSTNIVWVVVWQRIAAESASNNPLRI